MKGRSTRGGTLHGSGPVRGRSGSGRAANPRRAGSRRRGSRLLWPAVFGLAVVGAAAAVLASRRRPGERPHDDGEGAKGSGRTADPAAVGAGGAGRAAAGGAAAAPAQLWIAGPAGTLFVLDSEPGAAGGGAGGAEAVRGGVGHGDGAADPGAAGERLPVIFVHSLAGTAGQWTLQLDHLHRGRRAVAFDLRGHGESDPAGPAAAGGSAARAAGAEGADGAGGAYAPGALAGDVGAVADHFALRRFVLVGHSLGAAVAIAYAAEHAERVAGLLLVDPNGDQSRIPAAQIEPFLAALRANPLAELENYFRQLVLGGDRDAARLVVEDLRLTDEGAVAAAVAGMVSFSPLPALARYPGPKLSVVSEMNSLPYSLHNLLPDLPVQVLRGTGHWLMMDRPERFNQVLDEFLDRVEPLPT